MAPLITVLLLADLSLYAQEMPPRPISITTSLVQNLSFGTFCPFSSGGTVIISSSGSRSASGNIILLASSFSTALFYVEANPGTLVSILNGPDVTLNGSNGGSMILHIGNSNPVSPFVIMAAPPIQTVQIGGTLTAGSLLANPPGSYSGFLSVTFIQE
jgi:hypothetical protein